MSLPPLARLAMIAAAAVSLSACITVFPKVEPAQLYRFEGQAAASAAAPVATPGFNVLRAGGEFNRAASGDRLLGVSGGKTAYIAAARWVSPAQTLFDEALARAFDANPGPARLIARGEGGRIDDMLRVDVRSFETVYDHGPKAAPVVVVSLKASLVRADRTLVGQEMFEARVRAGDNRVSAIVAAYDQAVGEALAKLVAWTNQTGASAT